MLRNWRGISTQAQLQITKHCSVMYKVCNMPMVFTTVLNETSVLYCDVNYLKSIVMLKVVKLAIMLNAHRRIFK